MVGLLLWYKYSYFVDLFEEFQSSMLMIRELEKFSKKSFKPDEKSAEKTQFGTPLNIAKEIVESAVAKVKEKTDSKKSK